MQIENENSILGHNQASTNAVVYDAIKAFRDEVFDRIRARLRRSHGKGWADEARARVAKENWEGNVRHAQALRKARIVSSALIDELDAQDVSILPKIVEHYYSTLVATSGRRQELFQALADIVNLRHGIAHPSFSSVSVDDVRRAADRIITAATIILEPNSESLSRVREVVEDLVGYEPTNLPRLVKTLPPRHHILDDFIGRSRELETLYSWLDSNAQIWVIEGDGGKGKTSLAYSFAESLEIGSERLRRVIWLSAKKRQFKEGSLRPISPDFSDFESALKGVVEALGLGDLGASDELEQVVLDFLSIEPTLIILDDIDSLDKADEDTTFWFTNTLLRHTATKVLFTTRRALHGLGAYTTELTGFSPAETRAYLRQVSMRAYGDPEKLGSKGISDLVHRACEGSPLYLEDIVRLSLIVGKPVEQIVKDWKDRTGQAAREYALRREFDMLSNLSRQVLLAMSLADQLNTTQTELLSALNCREDDLTASIAELRKFYLISRPSIDSHTPTFEINRNLGLLVRSVMSEDQSFRKIASALKQIRSKEPRLRRVAADATLAIRDAVALVRLDKHVEAEALLRQKLADYPDEAALLSHLGWVLSRWPGGRRETEAIDAMQRAVDLNYRSRAIYVHLSGVYLSMAEYDKAARVLERGLGVFKDDSELTCLYARAVANSTRELLSTIDLVSAQSYNVVQPRVFGAVKALNDAIEISSGMRNQVLVSQMVRLRAEILQLAKNLRASSPS